MKQNSKSNIIGYFASSKETEPVDMYYKQVLLRKCDAK